MQSVKEQRKIDVIKKHLWFIISGAVIAGFITEIFNSYIITFWVYDKPWNSFFYPPFPLGWPLIFGWLSMAFIVVLLSIFIVRLKPRTKFSYAWIIGWIILGFIGEFINSKIWSTWNYAEGTIWTKLLIPYLNFSIFVPILGYGATGLVTYWFCKYIIMAFGKGKERDKVCYMKVSKRKWKAKYKRKVYYFCSKECKNEFTENPLYYTKKGFFEIL